MSLYQIFTFNEPTADPASPLDSVIPGIPSGDEIGNVVTENLPYVARPITSLSDWVSDLIPRLISDPTRFWFSVAVCVFILVIASTAGHVWMAVLAGIGGFWIGWVVYNQFAHEPLSLFPGQGTVWDTFGRVTASANWLPFAIGITAIVIGVLTFRGTKYQGRESSQSAVGNIAVKTKKIAWMGGRVAAAVGAFAAVFLVADFISSLWLVTIGG